MVKWVKSHARILIGIEMLISKLVAFTNIF